MSSIKKIEQIKKLEIYYSPKGYWRGFSAIKRLSAAAKSLRRRNKELA